MCGQGGRVGGFSISSSPEAVMSTASQDPLYHSCVAFPLLYPVSLTCSNQILTLPALKSIHVLAGTLARRPPPVIWPTLPSAHSPLWYIWANQVTGTGQPLAWVLLPIRLIIWLNDRSFSALS